MIVKILFWVIAVLASIVVFLPVPELPNISLALFFPPRVPDDVLYHDGKNDYFLSKTKTEGLIQYRCYEVSFDCGKHGWVNCGVGTIHVFYAGDIK